MCVCVCVCARTRVYLDIYDLWFCVLNNSNKCLHNHTQSNLYFPCLSCLCLPPSPHTCTPIPPPHTSTERRHRARHGSEGGARAVRGSAARAWRPALTPVRSSRGHAGGGCSRHCCRRRRQRSRWGKLPLSTACLSVSIPLTTEPAMSMCVSVCMCVF